MTDTPTERSGERLPSGVWERIVSGSRDEGVTTRFLRFDPGSGRDAVVTHDFWEEIYIVSGIFESGGRAYAAGCVAVRPPGVPHGPFHSATGCLNFEVRYRHPLSVPGR